jgi:hypothetical protein
MVLGVVTLPDDGCAVDAATREGHGLAGDLIQVVPGVAIDLDHERLGGGRKQDVRGKEHCSGDGESAHDRRYTTSGESAL